MNGRLEQVAPLVLVIDEQQQDLNQVAAILASANIACQCCTRPDEAFALALRNPPDLILCDTNLFGESGPETCERIKRQPGLEEVPVMFLSNAQIPDVIRRGHGANGAYCLRKPFAAEVLVGLIDAAITARPVVAADAS